MSAKYQNVFLNNRTNEDVFELYNPWNIPKRLSMLINGILVSKIWDTTSCYDFYAS